MHGTSYPEVYYLQPGTALAYDGRLGVQDSFEWHRASTEAVNARFEGLLQTLLQLSCVQTAAAYLGWNLIFLLNILQRGSGAASYTSISVLQAWYLHTGVAFGSCLAAQVYAGLRVFLREPFELHLLLPV